MAWIFNAQMDLFLSGKPAAKGKMALLTHPRKERTIPLEIMPKMKDKDGLLSEFTFEDVGK